MIKLTIDECKKLYNGTHQIIVLFKSDNLFCFASAIPRKGDYFEWRNYRHLRNRREAIQEIKRLYKNTVRIKITDFSKEGYECWVSKI
jgi:hypothetical protein